MAVIGRITEFTSNGESWESYIEMFELFVESNNFSDDNKVSKLLTAIGAKTFNLIRDLCTNETIHKIIQRHS